MSILSIGRWNYDRNGLDFNVVLEETMLREEIAEFKDGLKDYFKHTSKEVLPNEEDILDACVEMVDAYCDFMYVYTGTCIKQLGDTSVRDWSLNQSVMHSTLQEILPTHGVTMYSEKGTDISLLEKCFKYVIEANEAKPINKTSGKVTKGKDWKDPKQLIKQELLDAGFSASLEGAE